MRKTNLLNGPEFHSSPFLIQVQTFFLGHLFVALPFLVLVGLVYGIVRLPWQVVPVLLPYLVYVVTHRYELEDGNPWRAFSKNMPIFVCLRKYLGLDFRLAPSFVEAEANPVTKKEGDSQSLSSSSPQQQPAQFLLACFPHGVAAEYRILMEGVLPRVFPNSYRNVRTLAASILFQIPLVREMSLWSGCIDARKQVADAALRRGRSLVVLPGGEREQIRTQKGVERVYVQHRKGFVKLALARRVPLVPVYVFGVTDLYDTSDAFSTVRHTIMKRLGMCITLHSGVFGTFCPFPVQNVVVVGKPLWFEIQGPEPTVEEVTKAHTQFCEALVELFDEHKGPLGYGDRTLILE